MGASQDVDGAWAATRSRSSVRSFHQEYLAAISVALSRAIAAGLHSSSLSCRE